MAYDIPPKPGDIKRLKIIMFELLGKIFSKMIQNLVNKKKKNSLIMYLSKDLCYIWILNIPRIGTSCWNNNLYDDGLSEVEVVANVSH